MTTAVSPPHFSAVREFPSATADEAIAYFEGKLRLEVDPADVHFDREKGIRDFVIIDTRSKEDYDRERIPGAINLPHRQMNDQTTRHLPKDQVMVTYCWGLHCNGSTKGALRLARLGFRVKELASGIQGWKEDGFATESDRKK